MPEAPREPVRADVSFESCGALLRGWLYRPGGSGTAGPSPEPGPGVVMAHGLSAVKEMFLDDFARAFAAAGLTTLAYDHLGFGESGGTPRQSPDAAVQRQGYRDAVHWMARQDGVDPARIGIWGSSFSGGQVISLAAEDLPIAAAVAQVPFLGDTDHAVPAGAVDTIVAALERGDPAATVPAVTSTPDGNGVMYDDHAYEWFTRVAADRAPNWRNELLVAGLVGSGSFTPAQDLTRARVPLLLIVAPGDRLTSPAAALAAAGTAAHVELIEVPGGHFDVYEAGFAAASAAAVDWFGRHL